MPPMPKNIFPSFKQPPEVVFQPRTARGFQGGMNTIVEAIRPTLGPFARVVAVERVPSSRSPEQLDSGGMIARRIIALRDRDEDAGAMYLRGLLWNVHETAGDGVATAAVIFQQIFNQGLRYLAAGGNAMLLREHLESGAGIILRTLDQMIQPVDSDSLLTGVARTVCQDEELAAQIAETFALVGPFGPLDIRAGRGRGMEREYIAGHHWPGGLLSRQTDGMAAAPRVEFEDAAILISDLAIDDPQSLIPVMRAALEAQARRLVLVCSQVSDSALALLHQSRSSGKLQMIAVKTPGLRSDVQLGYMQDIAVLTGGTIRVKAAGDTLAGVQAGHFGRARRIWANADYFGLVHPQGDPKGMRRHIAALEAAFHHAQKSADRQQIQDRIGKLSGGAAALDVGGLTESEMEARKALGQRTVETLRAAAREGILPGGGSALLACRSGVDQLTQTSDSDDARAARNMLRAALEAPFRALVRNAGLREGAILNAVEQAGPGFGFDLVAGEICHMISSGIVDVASVQKQAVASAVRGAALALTVDILIHRDDPPVVVEPDAPGL